jgi:hydroxylamine reductase
MNQGRKDFSGIIQQAIALGGWTGNKPGAYELMTGFAHNAVMSVADKVVDAVKSGAVKHIYLVGGCDGAKLGRDYYTEFVEKTPKDTLVLTLACGKFRFNHLQDQLGDIGGIPRLLDMGQCNDAYSAIQVAVTLAKVFNCGVNDLPLSLILSWYEQKAVCILLTLLSLGIKNIRIGPTLPAFVSPTVLNVLTTVEKFGLTPITTADEDLARPSPACAPRPGPRIKCHGENRAESLWWPGENEMDMLGVAGPGPSDPRLFRRPGPRRRHRLYQCLRDPGGTRRAVLHAWPGRDQVLFP